MDISNTYQQNLHIFAYIYRKCSSFVLNRLTLFNSVVCTLVCDVKSRVDKRQSKFLSKHKVAENGLQQLLVNVACHLGSCSYKLPRIWWIKLFKTDYILWLFDTLLTFAWRQWTERFTPPVFIVYVHRWCVPILSKKQAVWRASVTERSNAFTTTTAINSII